MLRLIVDEFWRLQRERVGERELDGAKAYLTGSFPLTIETPESIAMQVVNALFYGLPLEQLQTFRERVNAVTVDDIQRVARDLLRPDRLSVVLVGNAAAFASQLRGVGFGTFETVELGDLDLTSANFKRSGQVQARAGRAGRSAGRVGGASGRPSVGLVVPALRPAYQQAPLASRPSQEPRPEDGAQAMALLDRAIAAKGGLEKLRAMKTIVARQTQASQRPDGESKVETTNYIQYPNRFRDRGARRSSRGSTARRSWMKDRRGVHDGGRGAGARSAPPACAATSSRCCSRPRTAR